jgi:hypothetical protein
MSPARADRCLAWLLRADGGLLVLALPAVPLPHAWMAAIHRDLLGMGELPAAPVVGYLARTASLLYALHGVILIALSLDVSRYRPLIVLVGVLNGLIGAACVAVDLAVGMPLWWTVLEGPVVVLVAVLTVALARRGAAAPAAGDRQRPGGGGR